jgi:DNA (cytosine-5)-methyltransferase 1
MRKIKVGSDFSGVGAFDQALKRLGIDYETIFSCDMDKFARTTYIHNYGEPKYYPLNVYDREIPEESLDIYMTSPPCQAFSLAGKRLGKEDKRGVLFFNSHEFIEKNKPRFFIFENVKGLLSDDNGNTFQEWVNMLGGKSVNGLPILFPYEDSVPYHIYWKVLNAKEHGVPQNRERVFIIGIRDDSDNSFRFPAEEYLNKRLKDVLEEEVSDKYFLSKERIETITNSERGIGFTDPDNKNISNCLLTGYAKIPTDAEYIKVKSATLSGYEIAEEGDSINFSVPNSETRRGRVGKQVAQTLDTACNQGIIHNCITEAIGRQGSSSEYIDSCKKVFQSSNQIRRLTPRECFRLMDFPDTFDFSCVSDRQAYKQAGNSIVVRVLEKIINNLPL